MVDAVAPSLDTFLVLPFLGRSRLLRCPLPLEEVEGGGKGEGAGEGEAEEAGG